MARAQRMSSGVSPMTSTSLPAKSVPEDAAAALARDGGDLVALFVVVGERAGLEDVPEIGGGAA